MRTRTTAITAAANAVTDRAAVTIRSAESADAAALADLSTQLGYPADAETLRRRLQSVRDAKIGEVFVAIDADEHILGWTHVVPRLILEEEPYAELAGLIVGENARGAGVGVALLRAAESWAREQGFAFFKVRSNVIRERAHRFYSREGYAERKRQIVFERRL
jgi:GNAT superfamily N-acetyltransferase